MPFSGAERSESLNEGEISLCYYYNNSSSDNTIQSKLVKGALGINEYDEQETFYGFSFSSQEGAYDGIWEMTDNGVSLVSANRIAMSSRYAVTNGDDISIFYNKNIMDLSDYTMKNLAYGSENNPIIIRSEQEFAFGNILHIIEKGIAHKKAHINNGCYNQQDYDQSECDFFHNIPR